MTIRGFRIGFHPAGSNPSAQGGDSDGKNARIVVRNSEVLDCSGQGWLSGCDGCGVEHTRFENNGFERANLNHNVYVSKGEAAFFMYNDLYKSSVVDGRCSGVSLVVHGVMNNLRIEGNTVREDVGAAAPNCWGIAVDPGYDASESFRNVLIARNTVVNVGNIGIGVTSCIDCVIENNVVLHEQPFPGVMIAAPNATRDDNDEMMDSVTIRNNTLVARGSESMTGIRPSAQRVGITLP